MSEPMAPDEPGYVDLWPIELFNQFIEDRIDPSLHGHFLDTDDNQAERVRQAIRAVVEDHERSQARDVVRYADAVAYGRNAARRFAHLRATITELSHHGDMTPTAKRVLMNVLDGVQRPKASA